MTTIDTSCLSVAQGTRVTLHFSITLESGEIIDSTFDEAPATFIVGDGQLPAGFEALLLGEVPGEAKTFTVTPEGGFGEPNPDNIQAIARHQFDDAMTIERGLIVGFTDSSGREVPGVITEVGQELVTVDFNHPLAGKTLNFTVEILSVVPDVQH